MKPVEGSVYCEVHGDIHDPVVRPYGGCPTEVRDGVPVWLDCETHEPMPPECGPHHWRKLWAGALMAPTPEGAEWPC